MSCPIDYRVSNEVSVNAGAKTFRRERNISLVLLGVLPLTLAAIAWLNSAGWLVFAVAGLAMAGILASFMLFEWLAQRSFSSVQGAPPEHMPKFGLIGLIYQLLIRRKTSLRDMDLERRDTYGDVYLMFIGYRPAVVVTSSALAKEIAKKTEIFEKSSPVELNMPYFSKWVGSNNVVLANGDDWLRLRAIVHKELTSTEKYFPTICQKALALNDNIDVEIGNSDAEELYLNRWLKAFSLDVAGETLFGYDFKHLKEIVNPAIQAMDLVIAEIFSPLRMAFPIVNKLPTATNRRLEASISYIDTLVNSMKAEFVRNASLGTTNLMKCLMEGHEANRLTDDELRNNIITLVLSSYETTQVSLGGVLYHLAKYPRYQEEIRRESNKLFPNLREDILGNAGSAYERFHKFALLDSFILESLRLYSPLANQNARTARANTQLGGFRIPAGTTIIINIHSIHMSGASWQDPDEFDPHRFDKGHRNDKDAFLAFGAGHRLCSGRNFSLLEQKVAVCCLLQNFNLSFPEERYSVPLKRTSFTGLPDESFRLRFERLAV
jgi:cytochrome P450